MNNSRTKPVAPVKVAHPLLFSTQGARHYFGGRKQSYLGAGRPRKGCLLGFGRLIAYVERI